MLYRSMKALREQLLSCPLHKVYQRSPPKWFCVPLFSLSESCALCGLLRKQSGLFIKPAGKEMKKRGSEGERAKGPRLVVHHRVERVQAFL